MHPHLIRYLLISIAVLYGLFCFSIYLMVGRHTEWLSTAIAFYFLVLLTVVYIGLQALASILFSLFRKDTMAREMRISTVASAAILVPTMLFCYWNFYRVAYKLKAEDELYTKESFEREKQQRAITIDSLTELLSLNPTRERWQLRGDQYRMGYQPELAIADYKEALKYDSTDADLYILIGRCYEMAGDTAAALPYFGKAVGLDSMSHIKSHYFLQKARLEQKKEEAQP